MTFLTLRNVSAEELMSANRVPSQMMGMMPNNTGGFGYVVKTAQVFVRNELIPLQERIKEINKWIGALFLTYTNYNNK